MPNTYELLFPDTGRKDRIEVLRKVLGMDKVLIPRLRDIFAIRTGPDASSLQFVVYVRLGESDLVCNHSQDILDDECYSCAIAPLVEREGFIKIEPDYPKSGYTNIRFSTDALVTAAAPTQHNEILRTLYNVAPPQDRLDMGYLWVRRLDQIRMDDAA